MVSFRSSVFIFSCQRALLIWWSWHWKDNAHGSVLWSIVSSWLDDSFHIWSSVFGVFLCQFTVVFFNENFNYCIWNIYSLIRGDLYWYETFEGLCTIDVSTKFFLIMSIWSCGTEWIHGIYLSCFQLLWLTAVFLLWNLDHNPTTSIAFDHVFFFFFKFHHVLNIYMFHWLADFRMYSFLQTI